MSFGFRKNDRAFHCFGAIYLNNRMRAERAGRTCRNIYGGNAGSGQHFVPDTNPTQLSFTGNWINKMRIEKGFDNK